MLTVPTENDPNQLCDWLELTALATQAGVALIQDVNGSLELESDVEASDFGTTDTANQNRIDLLLSAYEERAKSLKTSYPFLATAHRLELRADADSFGSLTYLLCLILSHTARDGILKDYDQSLVPETKITSRLFQDCATVGVAGHVHGPAYSLGSPRLDKSKFTSKLTTIYTHLGDGKPKKNASRATKDGGVDVVAWRESPSRIPSMYSLAQVASGRNWDGKSLASEIEGFHQLYFDTRPAAHATPYMVIPFLFSAPNERTNEFLSQAECCSERALQLRFGTILNRINLPLHVDEATRLKGVEPIEGLDRRSALSSFVADYRRNLQSVVSAS